MYPICVKCRYFHEETVVSPNKSLIPVAVCLNEEYRHPVMGTPLPCGEVRGHRDLCTLQGHGFLMKEEEIVENKGGVILEVEK